MVNVEDMARTELEDALIKQSEQLHQMDLVIQMKNQIIKDLEIQLEGHENRLMRIREIVN